MITLKQIRDNKNEKPCEDSWTKLLKSYGKTKADDTVVTCEYLLDTLGVDDALWVISNCIGGKRVKKRHMLADIAGRVLHIWENWAKDNAPDHLDAPRKAVDAVRNGKVNDKILKAAEYAWDSGAVYAGALAAAARAADVDCVYAADSAYAASYAAARAADVDCVYAAGAAYWAARRAALGAAKAAWAARHAAWAASAAAADTEREEQKKIILTYFGE